jgi:hypothetical protein
MTAFAIDRRDVREHLERTRRRYWFKEQLDMSELADQVIAFLAAKGIPVKDSDWERASFVTDDAGGTDDG